MRLSMRWMGFELLAIMIFAMLAHISAPAQDAPAPNAPNPQRPDWKQYSSPRSYFPNVFGPYRVRTLPPPNLTAAAFARREALHLHQRRGCSGDRE